MTGRPTAPGGWLEPSEDADSIIRDSILRGGGILVGHGYRFTGKRQAGCDVCGLEEDEHMIEREIFERMTVSTSVRVRDIGVIALFLKDETECPDPVVAAKELIARQQAAGLMTVIDEDMRGFIEGVKMRVEGKPWPQKSSTLP